MKPALIWALALGLAGAFGLRAAEPVTRPNIVLIVIDDLGYGDLGCYGNRLHRTPHLDRLAAEGARFTDFHSNGAVCSPTRTSILTGQYPQRSGIEAAIGFTLTDGVPLAKTTIAEVLGPLGYRCGVFGKWHVGHVTKFGPNDQGFHESYCTNNNPDYHSHVSRDGKVDWWKNQQLADEPGYLTDLVTRHTLDFIRANRDRPFFAYMPHLAAHFPFQGPKDPAHRTTGKKWDDASKYGPLAKADFPRAYREMIEAADASVGRVIALLEELALREKTLVFVCSDNGAYAWVGSNGPLRGQKGDLTEGGHRVPAIANWPGRIAPRQVRTETVLTMDLLPTLAAVAGTRSPDTVDGVDLSGLLFRNEALPARTLFWCDAQQKAVRRGPWKLVVTGETAALYDLRSDLGEQRDLAASVPERLRDLSLALAAWERDVGPRSTAR
ncbi:sulfatase-like hydrolase/transferase [Horticoccus sp. 23ND18S-11]|uniref:sulfatase-like hydrolase/transferase n=1 Tax=Horticoccus sp. 23ND18S-11 TaxID=3391832 RepID=UPI0039C90A0C